MKTNFLKTGMLTLMVSAFAMFAFTSCDKDDDVAPRTIKNQIVGTWEFTSFKVDTSEYMGTIVDTARVTFDAFTTGTQGNFRETVIYADGEKDNISGKYEVDEAGKKVKMIAAGETETVEVVFTTSNKMEWKGQQDGKVVRVKATRK